MEQIQKHEVAEMGQGQREARYAVTWTYRHTQLVIPEPSSRDQGSLFSPPNLKQPEWTRNGDEVVMQEERTSMHCWDRDEQEGRAEAKEKSLECPKQKGEKKQH